MHSDYHIRRRLYSQTSLFSPLLTIILFKDLPLPLGWGVCCEGVNVGGGCFVVRELMWGVCCEGVNVGGLL